jgi:hypothetical protein
MKPGMSDDPSQKAQGPDFDVVMLHGRTDDGEGTRVLRARPGRLEAGEVRPLREGKPLVAGEVVRLERRQDHPQLHDVHVQHVIKRSDVQSSSSPPATVDHNGPAQVATDAYRESWDRTFGERRVLN